MTGSINTIGVTGIRLRRNPSGGDKYNEPGGRFRWPVSACSFRLVFRVCLNNFHRISHDTDVNVNIPGFQRMIGHFCFIQRNTHSTAALLDHLRICPGIRRPMKHNGLRACELTPYVHVSLSGSDPNRHIRFPPDRIHQPYRGDCPPGTRALEMRKASSK